MTLQWSHAEKTRARAAFEKALAAEKRALLAEFATRAAAVGDDIDALWALRDWLNTRQRDIDRTYEDRCSQLTDVFAELVRRGHLGLDELAGLAAGVHDGALLDDDHELALVHRDDRPIRDDVALALGVRAAALVRDALLALRAQHVGLKRVAVEVLAPRVGQHAACSSDTRFDQTHDVLLLRCCLFVRYSKTY